MDAVFPTERFMTRVSAPSLRMLAVVAVVALTGCSEFKLGGTIDVNGKTSAVSACRVGTHTDGNTCGEAVSDAGYRVRMVKGKGGGTNEYTLVLYGPQIPTAGLTMACSGNVSTGWRAIGSSVSGSYAGTCKTGTYTVVSSFSFGGCKQGAT